MKPKPRYLLLLDLERNFVKDYEEISKEFPEEGKIELADHFLNCLEVAMEYAKNETDENWKKYVRLEDAFLLKWRSKLKLYKQKGIYKHLNFEFGLGNVMADKEFNSLDPDEQSLSAEEKISFLAHCSGHIHFLREHYLLQQSPEHEEQHEEESLPNNHDKPTISVQLLALFYLLRSAGIDPRSTSDISSLARLAHLILGKNFKSLQSSEIYKKLLEMPHHKSGKELEKDLLLLRPFFEKLNSKSLLQQIDADLKMATVSQKKTR